MDGMTRFRAAKATEMRIEGALRLLVGVRRSGRGWIARCPAHDDRHPSLSIVKAADGRILLHCFAGCLVEMICEALGILVADLFPETAQDPYALRQAKRLREAEQRRRRQENYRAGLVVASRREAECLVLSARGTDFPSWDDSRQDAAVNAVAQGHAVLNEEMGDEAYAEWARKL